MPGAVETGKEKEAKCIEEIIPGDEAANQAQYNDADKGPGIGNKETSHLLFNKC